MERVKLITGPSSVHGTGCFAAEDIEANQLVATWWDNLQILSERAYLQELETGAAARSGVRLFGPWFMVSKDPRIEEATDYLNHSDAPNLRYFVGFLVADRAIAAGEELFLNYRALNSRVECCVVPGWSAGRAARTACRDLVITLRASAARALNGF